MNEQWKRRSPTLKTLEVRRAYVGGEGGPQSAHSACAVCQHSREGRPKVCGQEHRTPGEENLKRKEYGGERTPGEESPGTPPLPDGRGRPLSSLALMSRNGPHSQTSFLDRLEEPRWRKQAGGPLKLYK